MKPPIEICMSMDGNGLTEGAEKILAAMRGFGLTLEGNAIQPHSYVSLFSSLGDAKAAAKNLLDNGIADITPKGSIKLKKAI